MIVQTNTINQGLPPSSMMWSPKMIVFDKDGTFTFPFLLDKMNRIKESFISCYSSFQILNKSLLSKGTLGDCTQALHTWSKRMTKCIIEECKASQLCQDEIEKITADFHHEIGWNPVKEVLLPSSFLSSGTWEQILDKTANSLENYSNDLLFDVREKVEDWNENLGDTHANDKTLVDDLPGLMTSLRQQYPGIAISICTSDDRRATDACIKNWNIGEHIDVS